MENQNQKIKKTVIFVSYDCNNNCRFCMEQDVRNDPSKSTQEVKKKIIGAKKRGSTYIEMIGGEITIREDFLELIEFARNLDFETVMIATNGRMFAYPEYAEKAIKAGLNSIVFSIHGHTPELHDSLTRAEGSFDQLHKGFKNIKKAVKKLGKEVHLGSNTTIVKQNVKDLPKIGSHIKSLGIRNSEFIFVDCNEGGAYNNFYGLVPKVSDAAPYIRKCLDLVDSTEPGVNWDVRYVPLCYFPDHLNQISELKEVKIFETEQLGRDAVRSGYDYQKKRKNMSRIKPDKCKGCDIFDICEGLWKEYHKNYGGDEVSPVSDPDQKLRSKIII